MGNFDSNSKIIDFTFISDSESRKKAIKDPIFIEKSTVYELESLIDNAETEQDKLNYMDHLDLLIEYQKNGISALKYFISFSQIELCFLNFCFGFNDFNLRKGYLLSNPFLMEQKSVKCINRFIERINVPNTDFKCRLFRNLLKACREIGIEQAFEEFNTPNEKYINAFASFIKTDGLYDLISTTGFYNDILSSKYLRNVMHYYQAKYEKNQIMRNNIISLWDYLSNFQSIKRNIWFWE